MADVLWQLERASLHLDGREILRDVSLELRAGEIVALVGPSGAGKTSLLRLLNGTLTSTSGTARFEGRDLAEIRGRSLREARSRIGFIHQDHALVPSLRVAQNLSCGRLGSAGILGGLRRVYAPSRSERLEMFELLERVGMAERLYERVSRLSGGEKQRIAVARALYQQPVALLADEPVASVDPVRARAVVEMLCRLAKEDASSLVCSLHDLKLAERFFPRTIGLREGRVVFDLPTPEIRAQDLEELYALEPT